MPPLHLIILAAGHGTRMQSSLPKVLHPIGGQPLLAHVIAAAQGLQPEKIHVIHGYQAEHVRAACAHLDVHWVYQDKPSGTAHAVQQALPCIPDDARVLVLCGDNPLISTETLAQLSEGLSDKTIGLLTAVLDDPRKLGRIIRDANQQVAGIVEYKDADLKQRNIQEINSGIMNFPVTFLKQAIPLLQNNNAQQEYYLTDCIAVAVQRGLTIKAIQTPTPQEVQGVNDKQELALMERAYQAKQVEKLMQAGATVLDPARVDVRGEVTVAEDVTIDINVIFEGKVTLGKGCKVGANCILKNVTVGDNTEILPNSLIEDSQIGESCRVGPFARLRPGTVLHDQVRVGNFVETKKADIGEGSKINHLSYIGDTIMGANVNVGAGTITCNYDGVNKFVTTIQDGAFIGSNTCLIAPVTIGENAMTGAGSTISKDAPADALTLSRAPQKILKNWKRPS